MCGCKYFFSSFSSNFICVYINIVNNNFVIQLQNGKGYVNWNLLGLDLIIDTLRATSVFPDMVQNTDYQHRFWADYENYCCIWEKK